MEGDAVKKYDNHFLRIFVAVVVMLVTFVHYNPDFTVMGYSVTDIIYGIGRFAMPVFFMISGYFLFSKDGHSESSIKIKVIRLLVLIVVMKIAYFILDLFRFGAGQIDVGKLLTDIIADPNYGVHEWFVYALLIMYVAWWGFRRFKIDTKYLLWLGAVLLAADIIVGEILPILGVTSFGNFMTPMELGEIMYPFIAVFSFSVGYYLHKYRERTDEYSNRFLLTLMFFGIVLMTAETLYVICIGVYEGTSAGHPGPNMYVGSVITMLTVFILSFRIREDCFRIPVLEYMGKYMLPWMYAFVFVGTCIIKEFVIREFHLFDQSDFIMYNVVGLILAILIDVVLAFIVYQLLKKLFEHLAKKKVAA